MNEGFGGDYCATASTELRGDKGDRSVNRYGHGELKIGRQIRKLTEPIECDAHIPFVRSQARSQIAEAHHGISVWEYLGSKRN